ncbi:hypothetical protein PLANTIT3_30250 [Plantibacter sp. T3]|nr:hypothetical protein PLANTIT3_30250 [Plantibacter sp. T3]
MNVWNAGTGPTHLPCNQRPPRTYPGFEPRPQIPDKPDRITNRGGPTVATRTRPSSPEGQLAGRPQRTASTPGCADHRSAEHRRPSMAVPAPRHETGLQAN